MNYENCSSWEQPLKPLSILGEPLRQALRSLFPQCHRASGQGRPVSSFLRRSLSELHTLSFVHSLTLSPSPHISLPWHSDQCFWSPLTSMCLLFLRSKFRRDMSAPGPFPSALKVWLLFPHWRTEKVCQLFQLMIHQFCNLENVRSMSARPQSARPQFLSLFQKLSSRAISLTLSSTSGSLACPAATHIEPI